MDLLAKNYSSLKRAETRNYKRFLKKNLPLKCIDGALADKVHKQGKHIPQHATFHTTIPT